MSNKWRGQTADIELEPEGGGTAKSVGILQGWTAELPGQETSTLQGSGSTEVQDVQKTSTIPSISGTVAQWDVQAIKDLVDYDSGNSKLDDSAAVKRFRITASMDSADGSYIGIIFKEAWVDGSLPIEVDREQHGELSLEFNAVTAEILDTEPA